MYLSLPLVLATLAAGDAAGGGEGDAGAAGRHALPAVLQHLHLVVRVHHGGAGQQDF